MKTALIPLILAIAMPAAAPAADQKCTGVAAAIPPEMAAWTTRLKTTAAVTPAGLAAARLTPGKAIDAQLSPGANVHFGDGPSRAKDVGDNAGLFAFSVDQPGSYRVALGSGGWVDVLENGKAVESPAHGHGPDCSGIVKMVDFPLKAGEHILQIEGSKEATVGLLVVRLP
jgi:hypothetical protein